MASDSEATFATDAGSQGDERPQEEGGKDTGRGTEEEREGGGDVREARGEGRNKRREREPQGNGHGRVGICEKRGERKKERGKMKNGKEQEGTARGAGQPRLLSNTRTCLSLEWELRRPKGLPRGVLGE